MEGGHRIKLQDQPFKVLAALIEQAGKIVTRGELQVRVWGPDTVVDFDQSLGAAIKKIRDAIGDSAENPRFIETLPRRGFRFIAPVWTLPEESPLRSEDAVVPGDLPVQETSPATPPETQLVFPAVHAAAMPHSPAHTFYRFLPLLTICVAGLVVALIARSWPRQLRPAPLARVVAITTDGLVYAPKDNLIGSLFALVTDGADVFAPTDRNGQVVLSQISVTTGAVHPVPLPSGIRDPEAEDISPDGTRLLVRSNVASPVPQPVWIVSVDGSSVFKVPNILVQDAIWMQDGKRILYTFGKQIAVLSLEDGRSMVLAAAAQPAFWPRWSPDGASLRFTTIDPVSHASSLWELSRGRHVPHPILKSSDPSIRTCCGVWTADGKDFVFEQTRNGDTDLWKVDGALTSSPVQITNGPLDYLAPSPGRQGKQIFFVGKDTRSVLELYAPQLKKYVTEEDFLSKAERLRYSRDGSWVAWVDPSHRLWRARADGTDRVLLTPPELRVFMMSWSPDNKRLAFMARRSGEPWQIYTVDADGSPPEQLVHEGRNVGDPSFSPDGKFLVFGTVAELVENGSAPRTLTIMDLATRRTTEIARSQGLFSPAWSPNGRFIAAITVDQNKLMLYDTETSLWQTLAVTPASWPLWSRDSRALFVQAYQINSEPILRVSVPEGKVETITSLNNFAAGTIRHAFFAGLSANDVPLMHAEIANGNLYRIDLVQKQEGSPQKTDDGVR